MASCQKICETFNGGGQVSLFKGVSRFLLSQEECPECGGVGFVYPPDQDNIDTKKKSVPENRKKRK